MAKFEQKCEKVADQVGVDVWFHDEPKSQKPFADDGMVHVCGAGLRAVFNIGQDCTAARFNMKAREIMVRMGKTITDRVLEDED